MSKDINDIKEMLSQKKYASEYRFLLQNIVPMVNDDSGSNLFKQAFDINYQRWLAANGAYPKNLDGFIDSIVLGNEDYSGVRLDLEDLAEEGETDENGDPILNGYYVNRTFAALNRYLKGTKPAQLQARIKELLKDSSSFSPQFYPPNEAPVQTPMVSKPQTAPSTMSTPSPTPAQRQPGVDQGGSGVSSDDAKSKFLAMMSTYKKSLSAQASRLIYYNFEMANNEDGNLVSFAGLLNEISNNFKTAYKNYKDETESLGPKYYDIPFEMNNFFGKEYQKYTNPSWISNVEKAFKKSMIGRLLGGKENDILQSFNYENINVPLERLDENEESAIKTFLKEINSDIDQYILKANANCIQNYEKQPDEKKSIYAENLEKQLASFSKHFEQEISREITADLTDEDLVSAEAVLEEIDSDFNEISIDENSGEVSIDEGLVGPEDGSSANISIDEGLVGPEDEQSSSETGPLTEGENTQVSGFNSFEESFINDEEAINALREANAIVIEEEEGFLAKIKSYFGYLLSSPLLFGKLVKDFFFKDGKPYARLEDGTEVDLTSEESLEQIESSFEERSSEEFEQSLSKDTPDDVFFLETELEGFLIELYKKEDFPKEIESYIPDDFNAPYIINSYEYDKENNSIVLNGKKDQYTLDEYKIRIYLTSLHNFLKDKIPTYTNEFDRELDFLVAFKAELEDYLGLSSSLTYSDTELNSDEDIIEMNESSESQTQVQPASGGDTEFDSEQFKSEEEFDGYMDTLEDISNEISESYSEYSPSLDGTEIDVSGGYFDNGIGYIKDTAGNAITATKETFRKIIEGAKNFLFGKKEESLSEEELSSLDDLIDSLEEKSEEFSFSSFEDFEPSSETVEGDKSEQPRDNFPLSSEDEFSQESSEQSVVPPKLPEDSQPLTETEEKGKSVMDVALYLQREADDDDNTHIEYDGVKIKLIDWSSYLAGSITLKPESATEQDIIIPSEYLIKAYDEGKIKLVYTNMTDLQMAMKRVEEFNKLMEEGYPLLAGVFKVAPNGDPSGEVREIKVVEDSGDLNNSQIYMMSDYNAEEYLTPEKFLQEIDDGQIAISFKNIEDLPQSKIEPTTRSTLSEQPPLTEDKDKAEAKETPSEAQPLSQTEEVKETTLETPKVETESPPLSQTEEIKETTLKAPNSEDLEEDNISEVTELIVSDSESVYDTSDRLASLILPEVKEECKKDVNNYFIFLNKGFKDAVMLYDKDPSEPSEDKIEESVQKFLFYLEEMMNDEKCISSQSVTAVLTIIQNYFGDMGIQINDDKTMDISEFLLKLKQARGRVNQLETAMQDMTAEEVAMIPLFNADEDVTEFDDIKPESTSLVPTQKLSYIEYMSKTQLPKSLIMMGLAKLLQGDYNSNLSQIKRVITMIKGGKDLSTVSGGAGFKARKYLGHLSDADLDEILEYINRSLGPKKESSSANLRLKRIAKLKRKQRVSKLGFSI
jgi:hypothetical protein